jgi:hypothetical protein
MCGVVMLADLIVVLLAVSIGSVWLVWVVWGAASSLSASYVYETWEAAVKETHKRAALGEATDKSPICLFQAAHHYLGFRYGYCTTCECFKESTPVSCSGSAGGMVVRRLPVCRRGWSWCARCARLTATVGGARAAATRGGGTQVRRRWVP